MDWSKLIIKHWFIILICIMVVLLLTPVRDTIYFEYLFLGLLIYVSVCMFYDMFTIFHKIWKQHKEKVAIR